MQKYNNPLKFIFSSYKQFHFITDKIRWRIVIVVIKYNFISDYPNIITCKINVSMSRIVF